MSPKDNVWADGSERGLGYAFAAVERDLRANSDNWALRALLLPHMSASRETYHQKYSANKNVGSGRANKPHGGGPVLAVDPPLKLVDVGLRRAMVNGSASQRFTRMKLPGGQRQRGPLTP
jgi:hypothetical protein